MKTAILGTGSWGTALAQVLADNGNEVMMWGINQDQIDSIENDHRNPQFFSCEINPGIHATARLKDIMDADCLLFAVPSVALESVMEQTIALLDHPVVIINVAKGYHPVTHERLSEYIKRVFPSELNRAVVSLIGPSHAEEVILRQLTTVNAVSDRIAAAKKVQRMFANSYFRVYTNTDVIGSEHGTALKNIMAIASGALEGLGQGDNAKAALITRGLAEISRFSMAQGGKMETFLGLCGVGDLIVTCMSHHSRNFMAGYEIGKANDAEAFFRHNTKTVEGIFACRIVYEEAQEAGISMPITEEVYRVLFEGKKPEQAMWDLMERALKSE